jgi:4-diphosphocytidyl-2-C-methyl-D-erythritol kinase
MIVHDRGGVIEVEAPAKLNLFLEILGKRPDGYHELETVMVAVDLRDTLRLFDDPSGRISLECDDPTLPTDEDNLVVRAALRLKDRAGTKQGVRIELKKLIPAQAGLAGGSSDAAATLVGLDRLWGLALGVEALDELASGLGSDVNFFLHGPAAVCRGRGERVEPINLKAPLHFVLVCPPVGVSTADVYRALVPPPRPRPMGGIVAALAGGKPADLAEHLFNRLQPIAESIRPELARVRKALADLGPLLDGHLMSGSGSAFFGLCRDNDAAREAANRLQLPGLGLVRAVTCDP